MCPFKLNVFEPFLISGGCPVPIIESNYVPIWLTLQHISCSIFFYSLMQFSSLNEKKNFVLNLTFKLEIAN